MNINEFSHQLTQLLNQAENDSDTNWSIKYLGKKGLFNQLAEQIKNVSDKKTAGIKLNQLKQALEKINQNQKQPQISNQSQIDYTLPAANLPQGHLHPITLAIEEISEIFSQLGFQRVRHPEVDLDENVFEKLNMPPDHPARDEWETFFISHPGEKVKSNPKWVLTTHTSNGQIHEMLRLKEPPIRMINISRCYRRQQDLTHTQMFHQFEGMMVDKDINITHLKGVLNYFAQEFYGPDTKSRIRPFHFQFTEPSFEIDFSCHLCHGTGKNAQGEKCRFCKSGWHEVGGAGMIHPNVLKAGGLDPQVYSGFAFGWGVERTYTLKNDLKINDIRNFYNGNLDFLTQF